MCRKVFSWECFFESGPGLRFRLPRTLFLPCRKLGEQNEFISVVGSNYDPERASGIENYENRGNSSQYGMGQNVFRIDVRKKVLGYGKYPDDIGPEYFVPVDRPDLIMEQTGWGEKEYAGA